MILNDAINQIAQIIWQNSGFLFRLVGKNLGPFLMYKFRCCQEVKLITDFSANRAWARSQITRFDSNSYL